MKRKLSSQGNMLELLGLPCVCVCVCKSMILLLCIMLNVYMISGVWSYNNHSQCRNKFTRTIIFLTETKN